MSDDNRGRPLPDALNGVAEAAASVQAVADKALEMLTAVEATGWWRVLMQKSAMTVEARSPQWSALERSYKADHPTCAACGTSELIDVHHIVPVHVDPSKELDPTNLVSLCMQNACHFIKGHLGSWQSWNSDVREDSAAQLKKIENRP